MISTMHAPTPLASSDAFILPRFRIANDITSKPAATFKKLLTTRDVFLASIYFRTESPTLPQDLKNPARASRGFSNMNNTDVTFSVILRSVNINPPAIIVDGSILSLSQLNAVLRASPIPLNAFLKKSTNITVILFFTFSPVVPPPSPASRFSEIAPVTPVFIPLAISVSFSVTFEAVSLGFILSAIASPGLDPPNNLPKNPPNFSPATVLISLSRSIIPFVIPFWNIGSSRILSNNQVNFSPSHSIPGPILSRI